MQVVVNKNFGSGPQVPPHVEFRFGSVGDVVHMVRTRGELLPEFFWVNKDPLELTLRDVLAVAVVLKPELAETRGVLELSAASEKPWWYMMGMVVPETSTLLTSVENYLHEGPQTEHAVSERLTTTVGWITQYLQGGCLPPELKTVEPRVRNLSGRVGYFSFEPRTSTYQSVGTQHGSAWAEVLWMYPQIRFGLMHGGSLTTYFQTAQYGLPRPAGFEVRPFLFEAYHREEGANFALYHDIVEALRCRPINASTS